jgi:hypothetical protein
MAPAAVLAFAVNDISNGRWPFSFMTFDAAIDDIGMIKRW